MQYKIRQCHDNNTVHEHLMLQTQLFQVTSKHTPFIVFSDPLSISLSITVPVHVSADTPAVSPVLNVTLPGKRASNMHVYQLSQSTGHML